MDLRTVVGPRDVIAAPGSDYDEYLGQEYSWNGCNYRIVQAAADIASAAKLALGAGQTGNAVNFCANDGDPGVGVVPADITTVSGTSGQIDQSSVFCVITRGSVVGKISTAESFAAYTRLEIASTGLLTAHAIASGATVAAIAADAAAISVASAAVYVSF